MNAAARPIATGGSSSLRAHLMRLPRPVRIALLVAATPAAAMLGVLVVSVIAELVLLVLILVVFAFLYLLSLAPSPSLPAAVTTGMLVAVQVHSWI